MRFKILSLLGVMFMLIITGCGSASSFSENDMGIRKVDDTKLKVQYDMSRSDAEKVLGVGEKTKLGFQYDSGVLIQYRDNKVAGIVLDEESTNIYETLSEVETGFLKDETMNIYGDEYVSSGRDLTYFYDTSTNSFIGQDEIHKETEEETEEIFVITVTFDDNGYANRIMLMDQRMANYLR